MLWKHFGPSVALSLCLVAATAIAAQAGLADPNVDGWGPFKFGMTLQQVRTLKVPGVKWDAPRDGDDREAILGSLGDITTLGSAYRAMLIFGWDRNLFARDKKLSAIRFLQFSRESEAWEKNVRQGPDAATCERRFRAAVMKLEQNFGPLSTTEKASSETGKTPGERTQVLVIQVGQSTYVRRDFYQRSRIIDPLSHITTFGAERDGVATIAINGSHAPVMNGSCDIYVDVIAKPPVK